MFFTRVTLLALFATTAVHHVHALDYVINDGRQTACYETQNEVSCPAEGAAYYGQDAQYVLYQSNLVNNGDGTISDSNTGLVSWFIVLLFCFS